MVEKAGLFEISWPCWALFSCGHCAPSSAFCPGPPYSRVPGTVPDGWTPWSRRKPISGTIFCPCVPGPSVTGMAIPRNNNLVSLIMALRPKLIDTRLFLISKKCLLQKNDVYINYNSEEGNLCRVFLSGWNDSSPVVTRGNSQTRWL